MLRPLRTVRGRVVDRQGKPVAGVEVFQSGDGPERTTTKTDADGRFSLGGFRQGPVFRLRARRRVSVPGPVGQAGRARRDGRAHAHERAAAREMRMLADPIPLEESRALARRLAEPLWATAGQEGEDNAKYSVLSSLASVDPARVLERLESVKFKSRRLEKSPPERAGAGARPTDFEEATAVAESIEDPATERGPWSISPIDCRPTSAIASSPCSIARCSRPGSRPTRAIACLQMGEVAERWYELGEVDKAKALFAEGLQIASQFTDKTDFKRGRFAARLARVDLPAALAIAKELDGDRAGKDPRRHRSAADRSEPRRSRAALERPRESPAGADGPDALLEDGHGRSSGGPARH